LEVSGGDLLLQAASLGPGFDTELLGQPILELLIPAQSHVALARKRVRPHQLGDRLLVERIHRNQPLSNLSQMSFTILQAAISKLEERHRIELLTEVGRGMKVIAQEKDRFSLEVREVADTLRPPIRSVAEYQERRRAVKR